MNEIAFESLLHEIGFECFGVRIGVRADDPRVWARLPDVIPPHARRCDAGEIEHRFTVINEDQDTFTLRYDVRDGVPARLIDAASWIATDVDLALALGLLETHIHGAIAFRAPDRIFVQAGAVAYMDRAIVTPGAPLTGKSTLVAALVRAGAGYYSDMFAVFDERGRVYPYATSLRVPGAAPDAAGQNGDQSAYAGEKPLPVGAIVMTSYRPGAEWRPERRSRGESVLALMSQTVRAQDSPEESMRVVSRVLDADPLVIASERDEADALAAPLLAEFERQFSSSE